jgi:hypothetical protein
LIETLREKYNIFMQNICHCTFSFFEEESIKKYTVFYLLKQAEFFSLILKECSGCRTVFVVIEKYSNERWQRKPKNVGGSGKIRQNRSPGVVKCQEGRGDERRKRRRQSKMLV